MTISDALLRLERFDPRVDSLAELSEIAEELCDSHDSSEALIPVLRFIERHADADLGSPGPLVHFVERFFRRGYEVALVESITRAPTPLTVWMLNRVVNGTTGAERESLLSVMRRVALEAKGSEAGDVAGDFLSRAKVNQDGRN